MEKLETISGPSKTSEIRKQLVKKFLYDIKSMKELSVFNKEFLKKINVNVTEKQKYSPTFVEDRTRLNMHAGVIISNHPGVYDSSIIRTFLNRDDVLFMTDVADFWKGSPLEKNFIKTPHDVSHIKEAFEKVKEHIEKGGVFMIFPTAGSENDGGEMMFKSGFRHMLTDGTLKKDTMIYAFNIQGKSLEMPSEDRDASSNARLLYFTDTAESKIRQKLRHH